MSVSFDQTVQAISADSPRTTLLLWGAAAIGIAAWLMWFGTASITLYESAHSAQVMSAGLARRIGVPDRGEITSLAVTLGQHVTAGDVLVTLDATAEQLAMAEGEQQVLAFTERARRLESEIVARKAARDDATSAARAAVATAETASDETLAALDFARGRLARLETLRQSGGASTADIEKARAELAALEAQQKGKVSEVLRLGLTATSDSHRAEAEIASLESARADIAAALDHARTTLTLLRRAVDRRTLRASETGTVGDLAPLSVGSLLGAGDYVLTIVPDGAQKIVAAFDAASALGSLKAGETATVRRIGGTDRRTWPATVTAVAAEPRDGEIAAELHIDAPDAALLHGEPVSVDVATRAVTPLGLVASLLGWAVP